MPAARVVHLCATLGIGGLEQVVVDLALAARAADHDDRVLTFDALGDGEPQNPRASDLPIESVSRRAGLDLSCASAIRRSLSASRAQVIHAHNQTALVLAALARFGMARRTRPRLLATFHNQPLATSLASRWITRWAAARADVVITVSEELRARLRQTGWIGDADVIVNGVDLDRFGPCSQPRTEGPLRIGMLARFAPPKRHDLLVAAVRQIAAQGVDLEVVVGGDGPDREAVLAGLRSLARVRLRGVVLDTPAFLREVDILVVLSEHEGTPLALLEAMAAGLPVIASAVGGIPAVGSEEDGVILVPNQPSAVATALGRLSNPALRMELGARARAHVSRRHSLRRVTADYERLYGLATS